MTNVCIQLAAGLAEEAKQAGLLSSQHIEKMLRQQIRLQALRNALTEGEKSGEPQPFDFDAFLHDKNKHYQP